MIIKMAQITVLILAIIFATFIKDGDKMDPPFKRRFVIDLTIIGSLWLLYGIFYTSHDPSQTELGKSIMDLALLYFIGQLIWLLGKLSPLAGGLIKFLKTKGVNVIIDEDQKGEK